jgi:hypothetical protein
MWRMRPAGCSASAATIRATNDPNDRRRHQVAADRDSTMARASAPRPPVHRGGSALVGRRADHRPEPPVGRNRRGPPGRTSRCPPVPRYASPAPWIRRYPHVLFSRARRSTSRRIDRMVGGRPTRVGSGGVEILACRLGIRSRCQRSTVSGRTSSRTLRRTSWGGWCSRAASHARSAGATQRPSSFDVRNASSVGMSNTSTSTTIQRQS